MRALQVSSKPGDGTERAIAFLLAQRESSRQTLALQEIR
jgi:hypothetical protein